MFAPIQQLDSRTEVAKNTRVFQGDGTPYLRVPGLKSVEQVRVKSTFIPLTEKRIWPLDASHARLQEIEMPIILHVVAADGHPVLLRNECSNDGIWQAQEPVYVTGDWDDAVPAPEPPVEEVKPVKKGLR